MAAAPAAAAPPAEAATASQLVEAAEDSLFLSVVYIVEQTSFIAISCF
jgi:hypothetical protein